MALAGIMLTASCASDEGDIGDVDDLGQIEAGVATACTVTASSQETSVVLGNTIHFSSVASCPSGTPEVQWYQKINSTWQIVRPYSTSATFDFDSSNSAVMVNQFYAAVRKQGTTEAPAASATLSVNILDNVPQCTSVKMTSPANNATGTTSTPFTLTALATCPSGTVAEYQFWVKLSTTSTWTVLPGYTTTSSSWTPPTVGTWNISAVARAVGAHVTYQVRSMSISTVVTQGAVNHAPVANTDTLSTFQATAQSVNVLANDTDSDGDSLSVTGNTSPAHGSVSIASGVATYTPTAGYVGSDSFNYTISDGKGGTATGTVNITVVDRDPVANTDSIATTVHATGTVDVLANDTDPDGDTLTVSSFTQGANGTVQFSGGTASYTPTTAGFAGSDSFTYTVSDGKGGMATGTVNVTVTDQAPVANDDSITTAANAAGQVDALANDTDADGDTLTVTSFTQGAHGSVSFTGGTATYTPATNFTGSDSFAYTIGDGYGGSATATISVTVTNLTPVANDDAINTQGPNAGSVDVLANDVDPNGDTLTVTSFTQGAHGTVSFSGSTATYAPGSYVGTDTFTYTISDGNGGSAIGTVNVTVTNAAPVAVNDAITTNVNTSKTFDPRSNDTDANGDALSVTAVTQPAHGTVTFTASSLTYTPTAAYTGGDAFTYTISDGNGGTSTATVSVTVSSVTPGCTISIASQETTVQWGQTIHFTATASCNTGAAEIQWYHRENNVWVNVQAYSQTATLNYTANALNSNSFYATARTVGTMSPVASSNTVAVNVTDNVPSCTSVKMTSPTNLAVLTVGTPVTLTALATCPSGTTPEYQFWVKTTNTTTYTVLPGYTTTSGSWTPPTAGTWNIKAVARAVGAHSAYQVGSSAITVTAQ